MKRNRCGREVQKYPYHSLSPVAVQTAVEIYMPSSFERYLFKYQIVDLSASYLGHSFNPHGICRSFRSLLCSLRTLHSFLSEILRYGLLSGLQGHCPNQNISCDFSLYASATNLDDSQKLPPNTDITGRNVRTSSGNGALKCCAKSF